MISEWRGRALVAFLLLMSLGSWGSSRVRARRKAYRESKKEWKVNNFVKDTAFAILLVLGISKTHLAQFDVACFERLKHTSCASLAAL